MIINITHTNTCNKKAAKRKERQDKWKAKWPNHCPHCLGNTNCGDPCEYCLYQLKCPRCGMEDAMDEYDATIPCKFCGYVEGEDAGCPHDYVCECRVAKEKKRQKELDRLTWEQQKIKNEITRLTWEQQKIKNEITRLKRLLY